MRTIWGTRSVFGATLALVAAVGLAGCAGAPSQEDADAAACAELQEIAGKWAATVQTSLNAKDEEALIAATNRGRPYVEDMADVEASGKVGEARDKLVTAMENFYEAFNDENADSQEAAGRLSDPLEKLERECGWN